VLAGGQHLGVFVDGQLLGHLMLLPIDVKSAPSSPTSCTRQSAAAA
jgi:hypothetical protein